jgi:bla regulator protein blaR1
MMLDHLWQSTLFAVVIWLLTLALRKNRAAVRYWMWLSASVKFLIPFSMLVSVGSQFGWRTAPAIAKPQISLVMEEVSRVSAAPVAVAIAAPAFNFVPVLVGIWLVGVAIGVVLWARWWWQIRVVLGSAVDARGRRNRLPHLAHMPVKISATRMEPGVVGIFRPVLLLPEGIMDRLTPPQMAAILAHELCHVRRRDNLTAAIHMVVETIFWFHPLVWWIRARLIDERERACDEDVLRLGSDPEIYAESILAACKFYLESPLACVAGVTGSDLKKRVEAIMANRLADKLDLGRKLLLAAVGIAAVCGPVAIGLANAPLGRAQSKDGSTVAFEVASVRAIDPGASNGLLKSMEGKERGPQFGVEHRTVNLRLNLYGLIVHAYDLRGCPPFGEFSGCNLLSGGPDWLRKDQFEVVAKMPDDAPDYTSKQFVDGHAPQLQLMLQTLLADRFQLKVHRETKVVPVFALTVGKKGPKFKKAEGSEEPKLMFRSLVQADGQRMTRLVVKNGTMQELVDMYSKFMDRPLVDQTGLKDRYDFTVDYEASAEGSPFAALIGPGLFRAFEEQAGLKLEATKGPVEILVIDHAEKPSAN